MKRMLISALTLIISLGLTWISICPTQGADLVAQSRDRLQDEMNEDFSSPPERIIDVSPASSQAIRIKITPDRSVVRPGEEISMSVETDVDCFLTLLSVGSSGKVIRLWPNPYSSPDNRVRAHSPIRIPDPDGDFKIRVDGSQPVERIIAYATTQKGAILDEVDFEQAAGGGLGSFVGGETELADTFETRVEQLPRSVKWGVTQVNVRVARAGRPVQAGGSARVVIEMRVPAAAAKGLVMKKAEDLAVRGFQVDETYGAIPVEAESDELNAKLLAANEEVMMVRGELDESRFAAVEKEPGVIKVWRDDEIEFYQHTCPFKSCDCDFREAKGTLEDVVKYLGADKIWAQGYRGKGIVIGIVDDGILAEGRHHGPDPKISGVIGGFPNDWGTKTERHGMMTATDVLGIAPEAELYDIRILGKHGSDAAKAFAWAIRMFKNQRGKAPQILSNSWGPSAVGVRDERSFARNPKHLCNRKVREAVKAGIIVLFAAGNCGGTCPTGGCAEYSGAGKSIWAPCGLPEVITVGAANLREEWVGYSSEGPAVTDKRKPDFCSITHFKGFNPCDNGTSAACPVAAGVVALLKQAKPKLTQKEAKELIMSTAKPIGPPGWNTYAGAGIIQPEQAFNRMMGR